MKFTTLFPLALSLTLVSAMGGTTMREAKTVTSFEDSAFDKGKLEWQSATGAYFTTGHAHQPSLDYSSTAYRLGLMLYTPSGSGLLRGNTEVLLQLTSGSVFQGPGNYLGGAALALRYNFVQPDAKWVPYAQVGVGAIYSDIYKDRAQSLLGQAWSSDLEATLGVRYFFNARWSANVEGGFRRLANLDEHTRNLGLNSLGAGVGLGYHF